ncbi:MAG: hypothetical protein MR665_06735 [Selenomonas bovis]|nr:hypothetical protein [Selenomonas bovis]
MKIRFFYINSPFLTHSLLIFKNETNEPQTLDCLCTAAEELCPRQPRRAAARAFVIDGTAAILPRMYEKASIPPDLQAKGCKFVKYNFFSYFIFYCAKV